MNYLLWRTHTALFIAGIGFIIWSFIFISEVFAQASVSVSPVMIEEKADPGDEFSFQVRATNNSSNEETYYILIRDITGMSPTGQPLFSQFKEKTGFEVSEWIQPSVESIVLGPDETGSVSFIVSIPQNAGPGGHFGGVFFTKTPPRLRTTGAGVGYQVGTLLNLRISGEISEEARVREFRSDKTVYSKPDVTLTARIENIGNVLIRPRGPIEISDFFGKKKIVIRINDDAAGILPGHDREFTATWRTDDFAFGRYQALMSMVYGDEEKKTISSVLTFWVLPVRGIGIAGGSIIVFIAGIFFFVRIYIRRKIRQMVPAEQQFGSVDHNRLRLIEQELLLARTGAQPSRLLFVAIALLIFTVLFLAIIFFMFA